MTGTSPDSHHGSAMDSNEARAKAAETDESKAGSTIEAASACPSAATYADLPPTESADAVGLDSDLIALLGPSDDPAALGRMAHYDIIRLLGRGGMGRVFEAFDTALRRTVAIKLLAAPLAASSMARRRFLREARAAAALNHPNIVTIHAVGEHGCIPYIVMEYFRGGSLSDRLARRPRCRPPRSFIWEPRSPTA